MDNLQTVLNKSRKDKFLLTFTLPNALKKIQSNTRDNLHLDIDTMQFSIYGTIVPKIEKPAVEIRYSGSTLYNSAHSINPFPPVNVKFTIDNRYNNYWVIYQWLNLLQDEKTGIFDQRDLISKDEFSDYQTEFIITALDEYNNKIVNFTYTKAFPVGLSDLTFDYRSDGELECSFDFVYSQLHVNLIKV
jgi:hypothetical protein